MSEKPFPVLAENISVLAPLDEATHQVLDQHGVDEQRRQQYADKFTEYTAEQLARLELAIALSRPHALEPVVSMHDEISIPQGYRDLDLKTLGLDESVIDRRTLHSEAKEYEAIKHTPGKKLKKDGELVLGFLRGLGVTNPLRTPEGYDAAFELGSMRRLLQQDYEALAQQSGVEEGSYRIDPKTYKVMERRSKTGDQSRTAGETEQYAPELRLVEALVAEQIALLWHPKAIGDMSRLPEEYRDLVANTNDTNVFSDQDLNTFNMGEKWCLIGAQQCYEAAILFKNIYHSKTTTELIKIQALSRWIDMEIRGRLIERILAGPEPKQQLESQIRNLANTQRERAFYYQEHFGRQRQQRARDYNRQHPGHRYEPTQEDKDLSAAAFESVVVAVERKRLLQKNVFNAYIRLAMPGEDQIHEDIRPLIINGNQKLNLSSDVIKEGLDGNRITAFQAKAMPEEAYRDISSKEEQRTGVKVVYPSEMIGQRFTNSEGYSTR